MTAARMPLSVIVTSYNSPATLRRCLESLAAQRAAAEIIVADCSPRDPALDLATSFPHVRFLHFAGKRTVPELRWAALRVAHHDLIAVTEARCVPSRSWCRDLVEAHAQAPAAPVVGGPVTPHLPATPPELGLYFCEYGRFARAPAARDVRELSLANLAYKRDDLRGADDLLALAVWDTAIHERWLAGGRPLRMAAASVEFENSMDLATIFRQRFHYGRSYAAQRTRDASLLRRLAYAGGTVALPGLLTWRIASAARGTVEAGHARPQSLRRLFARAFVWVVLFNAAWAAGELVGYVGGAPEDPQIF